MQPDADVLVVGYGPAGQAVAILLAQLGWRVAVLERQPEPYNLPRAVGYDHEVARILQACGVARAMNSQIASLQSYDWRDANGDLLISFPGLDEIGLSGWPNGVAFSQPDLERVLDERVRQFGDLITLHRGWDAVEVTSDAAGIAVTAVAFPEGATREPLTLRARYLIGCDGAGSFVRQVMGSSYRDLGFAADWVVADLRPRDPELWNTSQVQICDPARPRTLVCGGPGRRRVELMLLPGERREDFTAPGRIWPLLQPLGWTPENVTLERVATYHFRACIARLWRRGKMILAGDAAHLTPPFAGQGLCAAFRDVQGLVWRLDLILDGRAGEELLDTYQPEREPNAAAFIAFAVELGKVICLLDPVAAAKRDQHIRSAGAGDIKAYPVPALGASRLMMPGDPHAGALSLQAPVSRGGETLLLDDATGTGFRLIGSGHDPWARLSAGQREIARKWGVTAVAIGASDEFADPTGAFGDWFAALGTDCVLVRPDFYLFGAGSAPALIEALDAAIVNQTGATP